MRKFYLFTLALLSAVGAWAQDEVYYALKSVGTTAVTRLTSGNNYVIKCSGQGGQKTWMYDNGNGGINATNAANCPTGINALKYVWTVTSNGDGTYKFTNYASNKQITFNLNRNDKNEVKDNGTITTTNNGTNITIEVSGDNVGLKESNGQYIDMGNSGNSPCTWSGGVSGSRSMTIYEASVESVDDWVKVVYDYRLDGETKKISDAVVVQNGDAYPSVTGLPYGITATTPSGNVALSEATNHVLTKIVTCTQNLPFEAFNSVRDITKWYYVKMHSNSTRTRYIREDASGIISFPWTEDGTQDNEIFENDANHNSALWGFVGDAFGMKLVSKSGKVVVFTGSGAASFANNEAQGTNFVLTANVYNSNDWFCMKHPTMTQYMNADATAQKVTNWHENDNGSSMQVEETVVDLVEQMAAIKPFGILENSTVQGPSEFENRGTNPTEINNAISDFKNSNVANGTLSEKRTFVNSTNGQKLKIYLEEVAKFGALATIQIEMQAQYGTLIMPCPSSAVAGLKTYTCSGVNANNVVTLTLNVTNDGADGALKQNVPYIIEANPGDKFTIIGWDKGSRETHTDDNGYLTGVLTKGGANIPVNSYVLAKTGDKVGFFKVTGNNVTCPQYKCYLTVTSNARAFYFSSDDVETGINAVEIEEATPANAVIYDLSGRRVQGAKSGLYIVNGKKVIK